MTNALKNIIFDKKDIKKISNGLNINFYDEKYLYLFPINMEEHNSNWQKYYEEEKEILIKSIKSKNILRIEHFGGTSISGICAKPIIDILVEIKKTTDLTELISNLEKLNYFKVTKDYYPLPKLVFMKGYTALGFSDRVFHLHIRYFGNWDELYFRDYLRLNPNISAQYGQLKKKIVF